jgi:hypothetical protein
MTSRRTRNLLAVVLLATAMLADRAVVASPAALGYRPQMVESAGRLMQRLTVRLQKVVPGVKMVADRRAGRDQRVPVIRTTGPARSPAHEPTQPFYFRLPPPVIA